MARGHPLTACLGALFLIAMPAAAHKLVHPKILRLGVTQDRLVLALNYDLDPGPDSQLLRRLFDRDSDGVLSPEEQAKVLEYLERTANLWLELKVGGKKAVLERKERRGIQVDLPSESSQGIGIALLYTAPILSWLPDEDLEIRVIDRDRDKQKHVPLMIDLPSGAEVRWASQGELHPRLRQIHRVKLMVGEPLDLLLRRVHTSSASGP